MRQAAETVGATLGRLMAKVDAWNAQRAEIARELRAAADKIAGGESPFAWVRGRGKSKALPATAGGDVGKGRKRRKMSADARAKISAAQRARWAKQKGQAGTAAKAAKKVKRGRKAKGEGTSTNG